MDKYLCINLFHGVGRLYNFISQYGRVQKIYFFTEDILQSHLSCKVVMGSKEEAELLVSNVVEKELFGQRVGASVASFDASEDERPLEFEMEDGSRSCKKFLTDGWLPFPVQVVAPTKVKTTDIIMISI